MLYTIKGILLTNGAMSTQHSSHAKKTIFDGLFYERKDAFLNVVPHTPDDQRTDKYIVIGNTCIRWAEWLRFKSVAIKNEGLFMDPKTQRLFKARCFQGVDGEILDKEILNF